MIYSPRVLTIDQVRAGGGFKIVYADPPWSYDQKVRKTLDEAQYVTMSTAEVTALPVERIVADDCALFLWATWPNLPAAFDVISAWGFTYKTLAFVWVKRSSKSGVIFTGCGSWTRANSEPCLLAVRGKPKRVRRDVHSVVEVPLEDAADALEVTLDAPVGRHSAKPPIVRDQIIDLLGDLPALEMFARDRDPRFSAWGDDLALGGSDVVLEAPALDLPRTAAQRSV